MQFQADICQTVISRPVIKETTALGAAYLAGLAVGVWNSTEEIRSTWTLDREFIPVMTYEERCRYLDGWRKAVDRAKSWA
jgi:glycerol kinase